MSLLRKPIITIFYQFNPAQRSIGGIQSLIGCLIKFTPKAFDVRVVGTGSPSDLLWVWQPLEWQGRAFQFLPIMTLENDNRRQKIPTTLRYTHALLQYREPSDFFHFHRLEYGLASHPWLGHKTLFIHNDLTAQLDHSLAANATLWQAAPWLYQQLESMLLPQFQQIFSCNSRSLTRYQQQFPKLESRLHYFHNAIDPERYYPLPLDQKGSLKQDLSIKWKIPTDRRWLLFAGRLHPQKDPHLLLEAFAALNDPTTHLIIAGDGELLPTLIIAVARLKLGDRVSFLGPLDASEVIQFQQTCDFVVLTSAYEGLPMVVLESLACGTPVLTTQCGETPRLLSPASGRVAASRTVADVRDVLQLSIRDQSHFTAEACVQSARPYFAQRVIEQVYQTLWSHWVNLPTESHNRPHSIRSHSFPTVL